MRNSRKWLCAEQGTSLGKRPSLQKSGNDVVLTNLTNPLKAFKIYSVCCSGGSSMFQAGVMYYAAALIKLV